MINSEFRKILIDDDDVTLQYIHTLLDFPFENQNDVDVAFKNYVLPKYKSEVYKYVVIKSKDAVVLDQPFTIRSFTIDKKVVEQAELSKLDGDGREYVEEESSEGEVSEDNYFHGDIQITNQDLWIKGKKIMENSSFTIVRGRVYGLVGRNGIGKSTLLKAIRKRKFGISRGLKMHLVRQEGKEEDRSVMDYVVDGNYDNEDDLREARDILSGLGFNTDEDSKEIGVKTNIRDLSGGWVVRVSLARAVFLNPDLLLLDEPTNMLDIPSIVWLEKKIKELNTTVIIVSHDREFLNNVCTDVLHLDELKVETYKGNYDSFVTLRKINLGNQQKAYEKQKVDREHLQAFIDKFRYNAKRASLAQSKIKIMESMVLLKPIKPDPIIRFKFDFSEIRGVLLDLLNVSFSYKNKTNGKEDLENKSDMNSEILEQQMGNISIKEQKVILCEINIKITEKSRIVIVGPNGAGKSTFLKILSKKLEPTAGSIIVNPNLRQGYFTQHHIDQLNLNQSVLEFIMKKTGKKEEESRRALASFGLTADRQKIGTLSGGQKSRLAFSALSSLKPNILLLDEPTNHLDIESIDGLANCLQEFKGAVICVSHDLKFVESVFSEVWICKNGKLELFKGTIRDYRNSLSGKK